MKMHITARNNTVVYRKNNPQLVHMHWHIELRSSCGQCKFASGLQHCLNPPSDDCVSSLYFVKNAKKKKKKCAHATNQIEQVQDKKDKLKQNAVLLYFHLSILYLYITGSQTWVCESLVICEGMHVIGLFK